jgi:dTDP-glucose 4,6-dehydratase
MDLSIYGGTGLIGSYFHGAYGGQVIPKLRLYPLTDKVLYFISTTDNKTFRENPHIDVHTNLVVLLRHLEACRVFGVKEFNFISSWFVYGPDQEHPNEDSPCNPNGFYSITKHTAEKLVKEYCTEYEISYRILRLGNVYGGPDNGNKKRNALHFLINRLKNNEDVLVHLNLSRDFIHMMDVCRAIDFVCTTGEVNEIYNIGTGVETKLSFALDHAKKILGVDACVSRSKIPNGYDQAVRFSLDCTKLHALGFKHLISVEEGIKDLCQSRKFSTPDPILMGKKLPQQ